MNWGNYLLMSIVITFTNYLLFKCYEKVEHTIRFKGAKHIIILLTSSLLMILNYFVIPFVSRPLFTYVLYLFCLKLIYGSDIKTVVVKGTYVYFIYFISDFLLSIILMILGNLNILVFDMNIIFKSLFTTLVIVIAYFVLYVPIIRRIIYKIEKHISKSYLSLFLLIFVVTFSCVVISNFFINYSFSEYFISLFFLISFTLLFSIYFIQDIKMTAVNKENEILLNFITKYEKIIDDSSIARHEMLNNLLIIKNFEDKKSNEYNELIDHIISQYNTKSDIKIKNISKLPKGIKGILYYKLSYMDSKNIDINVKISSQVNSILKNISYKNYFDLSKILGIVLDNACEAACLSKSKLVFIDVYLEKKRVIFQIENTYKGKIDLRKINNKHFSTKGKNRGFGLAIASNIVKSNNIINLEQFIKNEMFVSKIIINKKSH